MAVVLVRRDERELAARQRENCVAQPVYVVRDPRAVAVSLAHYVAQSIDETITWVRDHLDRFRVESYTT